MTTVEDISHASTTGVEERAPSTSVTQYLPVLIERMSRDELTRHETSP